MLLPVVFGGTGLWRSLVAHLTGGQVVAGSNPVSPTEFLQFRGGFAGTWGRLFGSTESFLTIGSMAMPRLNYHPKMLRAMVLSAAAAFALWGVVPATAEPAPAACSYTLTRPQVVQLSGTNVVTATLSPTACDRSVAYQAVACVRMQGEDGPGQCAQQNGILMAQVFYQPYRPGATYTATGRGCANTGNPPQQICESKGPIAATL